MLRNYTELEHDKLDEPESLFADEFEEESEDE